MRINIDEKILSDPRVKLAAARLRIGHYELIGRLLPVWTAAYNARSAVMPRRNVDVLSELPGFADALVAEDMANACDGDCVRLRGVAERIEFLLLQDAKRAQAVRAKREAAGLANDQSAGRPAGQSELPAADHPSGHAYSLTLSPDQAPDLTHAHDQDQTPIVPASGDSVSSSGSSGTRSRSRTFAATPQEREAARLVLERLGEKNGTKYTLNDKHLRLIVERFREGVSVNELRAVTAYCADEWRDKPKMQQFLRPETLFSADGFAKYRDPACSRYAAQIAEAQRAEPAP
jgi:uncharacterized phage protein (TIGR02220 family)